MAHIKLFRLKQKQYYCLYIIGVIMLVECIGCTSTISSTATSTIPTTITNDQSGLSTQTTQKEVTYQPTATNTAKAITTPVLPVQIEPSTPSPTITSSPTPEATPTLTNGQKADNFTALMTGNGGCELPCWWGIVLGETEIETIPEMFVPQGLVWWEEWSQLDASRSGSGALVTFSAEESIIQSIKVRGGSEGDSFEQDWGRYSLDQALTRYGIPTQVFVYHPWQADPGPPFFHLLLFYETLGIEIDYVGVAQHISDGKSRACPNLSEISQVNLFLYQPEKINNVVEMVLPPQTVDSITSSDAVYDLIKWEQAVGTSLESFYETFKNGDNISCFDFMIYR